MSLAQGLVVDHAPPTILQSQPAIYDKAELSSDIQQEVGHDVIKGVGLLIMSIQQEVGHVQGED